jgi:hypothetical protein
LELKRIMFPDGTEKTKSRLSVSNFLYDTILFTLLITWVGLVVAFLVGWTPSHTSINNSVGLAFTVDKIQ